MGWGVVEVGRVSGPVVFLPDRRVPGVASRRLSLVLHAGEEAAGVHLCAAAHSPPPTPQELLLAPADLARFRLVQDGSVLTRPPQRA